MKSMRFPFNSSLKSQLLLPRLLGVLLSCTLAMAPSTTYAQAETETLLALAKTMGQKDATLHGQMDGQAEAEELGPIHGRHDARILGPVQISSYYYQEMLLLFQQLAAKSGWLMGEEEGELQAQKDLSLGQANPPKAPEKDMELKKDLAAAPKA